jgi:hypothetical protein
MVSWQGAWAFTNMNQPLIPAFADPANNLVGFGVSGIVGASGPALAGSAFHTFAHTGTYPTPGELQQFPLGYSKLKFDNAYAEQASLEIENEIAKDTFVSVGYQFIHALKLPIYSSIDGLPSGIAPDGVQLFTPADSNFGFTLYVTPSGYSNYNAGIVSFRKNFAHYYSVLANFSKSLDLGTEVQLNDVPMDFLNPGIERAVSDNDVRQRFILTALVETPSHWPLLVRNFKVSMLTTLQSPLYYTILGGFDVNGDQFPFNDRVGEIGATHIEGIRPTRPTSACKDSSILPSDSRAKPAANFSTFATARTSTPLTLCTAPRISQDRSHAHMETALPVPTIPRLARRRSLRQPDKSNCRFA